MNNTICMLLCGVRVGSDGTANLKALLQIKIHFTQECIPNKCVMWHCQRMSLVVRIVLQYPVYPQFLYNVWKNITPKVSWKLYIVSKTFNVISLHMFSLYLSCLFYSTTEFLNLIRQYRRQIIWNCMALTIVRGMCVADMQSQNLSLITSKCKNKRHAINQIKCSLCHDEAFCKRMLLSMYGRSYSCKHFVWFDFSTMRVCVGLPVKQQDFCIIHFR